MRHSVFFCAITLAAFLTGCEKTKLGSVDPNTNVPYLSSGSVSPDSIFIDNQIPINGQYSIDAIVRVKAALSGSGDVVTATVLRPTGSEVIRQVTLRDDGISPDTTAGDSVFTSRIQFSIHRALTGRYRIQFVARTSDGSTSSIIERALKLTRRNAPPVLHSVASPDSVNLPTSGFITVLFTAVVSDSDGIADIQQVFFTRAGDSANTRFFLKDDGGVGRNTFAGFPDPLPTGDDVAGDGRFSILLPVTPSNSRGTRIFIFQAIDSFGDTSRTIQRSFTIR